MLIVNERLGIIGTRNLLMNEVKCVDILMRRMKESGRVRQITTIWNLLNDIEPSFTHPHVTQTHMISSMKDYRINSEEITVEDTAKHLTYLVMANVNTRTVCHMHSTCINFVILL